MVCKAQINNLHNWLWLFLLLPANHISSFCHDRHQLHTANDKTQFIRPTCAVPRVRHSVAVDVLSHSQHHHAPSSHLHDSVTNQQLHVPVDRSLTPATPWSLCTGRPLYAVLEADQRTSVMCNNHIQSKTITGSICLQSNTINTTQNVFKVLQPILQVTYAFGNFTTHHIQQYFIFTYYTSAKHIIKL